MKLDICRRKKGRVDRGNLALSDNTTIPGFVDKELADVELSMVKLSRPKLRSATT